jgi:cold shock CspA family protein
MGDVATYKIRKWFGDKGYGFARPEDAGPRDRDRDVFVHARALDASLQHLTRLDYPVMNAEGRPDFAKSPAWPALVFIETEIGDKGPRAVRVADVTFTAGDREAGGSVSATATSSTAAGGGANYAGPRNAPRSQRNPQEGGRPAAREDKKGGGRRGSWGSRDDDF